MRRRHMVRVRKKERRGSDKRRIRAHSVGEAMKCLLRTFCISCIAFSSGRIADGSDKLFPARPSGAVRRRMDRNHRRTGSNDPRFHCLDCDCLCLRLDQGKVNNGSNADTSRSVGGTIEVSDKYEIYDGPEGRCDFGARRVN